MPTMTDERIGELLEEAYGALDAGRLDRARRLLDQLKDGAEGDRDVVLLEVDLLLDEAEGDEDVERAIGVLEDAVEADPEDPVLAAMLASHLVELFGDYGEARPLLESAAEALSAHPTPEDAEEATEHREFLVDVLVLLSEARSAGRDPRGALAIAERARELDREDPATHLSVATARFDLCDLEGARRDLEAAMRLDRRLADGFWLLGRIETAEGREAEADKAFRRAVQIDPESYSPPTRVTEDELAAIVEEGLEELPDKVRDYLENVAVAIEDSPDLDRLRENDPPLSPGSLGMFEGTPPAAESTADPWTSFPRQITLFRRNLEIDSRDMEELRDLAVTTLLHEVGHYLGLDEEDLEERGLA